MTDASLFDRVGGESAIQRLVGQFYDRVLADGELRGFFEGVSLEKLRDMQHEFFSAALGGPIAYSGRSLSEAHVGRGIRSRHVSRFLDHLLETLQDQGLEEDDVYDIYSRINTYADEITGATTVDG